MTVIMTPGFDPADTWPTLGLQLASWMQEYLVHGPGDVRGEPYSLDPEKIGVLCRMYEVHPLPENVDRRAAVLRRFEAEQRWKRGQPLSGRRRFKREGLSVRKGWAKTELAAACAAGELHPDAPVRTIGWSLERGEYVPIGGGVFDPYVPMVAYTDEQSEELAYGALKVMIEEGPLGDDFDCGVDRILVIGSNGKACGKAVHLSAAPDSRDGARTTFQVFDETHRQRSERLRHAHETMLANIPKRLEADAHTLEVTTAYEPGTDSIAEGTHEYAKLVADGKVDDELLFYYHREASDVHDLTNREGMTAAVLEASGPAAEFTDVDYIVSLGLDPQVDRAYWERVWLNRVVASGRQFFSIGQWDKLTVDDEGKPIKGPVQKDATLWYPPRRALVTLGFDGSRTRDGTGIVLTDVKQKRQAVLAYWECPRDKSGNPIEGWEVPREEVDAAVDDAFKRYDVALFYADPYWWEELVAVWHGRYGTRRFQKRRLHRVVVWDTNRPRPMALSLRAYLGSIKAAEITHNGDLRLREHLANSRKRDTGLVMEDEGGKVEPLHTIAKERRGSSELIDLAMAADLSFEAYRDAVSLGVTAGGSGSQLHAW